MSGNDYRYETVPHEVEAIQLTLMTLGDVVALTGATGYNVTLKNGTLNLIITVNNVKMLVIQDDWIVKDDDEILIVKKRDFEANYRKLED